MEAKDTTRLGRRTVLAATLGGVAAAAGALAAPTRVLGANGDPVLIGQNNTGTLPTQFTCTGGVSAIAGGADAGHGVSGFTNAPSNRAGLYGIANQAGSSGVGALNNASHSQGNLATGHAGVEAIQGGAPLALDVFGSAHFHQSGVAIVSSGKRFVQVDVEGLTGNSFALATLQQYRADLWVQSITVSVSTGAIYIYVSRYAPSATRVAWMVFH